MLHTIIFIFYNDVYIYKVNTFIFKMYLFIRYKAFLYKIEKCFMPKRWFIYKSKLYEHRLYNESVQRKGKKLII